MGFVPGSSSIYFSLTRWTRPFQIQRQHWSCSFYSHPDDGWRIHCAVFPPRADAGQLEESGNIQLDYTPPDPQVVFWEKRGSGSRVRAHPCVLLKHWLDLDSQASCKRKYKVFFRGEYTTEECRYLNCGMVGLAIAYFHKDRVLRNPCII